MWENFFEGEWWIWRRKYPEIGEILIHRREDICGHYAWKAVLQGTPHPIRGMADSLPEAKARAIRALEVLN